MSNKSSSISETIAAVVISAGAIVTGTVEAGCKTISSSACDVAQVASETLQGVADTKLRSKKD
ncbi:hypothetical protein [Emticicia sp. W12TSBA100-4]|uniref:hypothetical protein n=1 Tax=Emticicia sp. W12TSBA100-4 TaxID=3160965 RepID=UPI003306580E